MKKQNNNIEFHTSSRDENLLEVLENSRYNLEHFNRKRTRTRTGIYNGISADNKQINFAEMKRNNGAAMKNQK